MERRINTGGHVLKNLISGASHPVLLGKRANMAVTDQKYARVCKLVLKNIPAVKGVVPIRLLAGFLSM